MRQERVIERGFALPTVLIASVVLLAVLAGTVVVSSALRSSLREQYYLQLAQLAGESGTAYAKACLEQSGNIPTWSDENPLRPNTDCYGRAVNNAPLEVLVVAGGGAGGDHTGNTTATTAGGGGAGGVIFQEVPTGIGTTAVTVGAGGAPVNNNTGGSGGASTFGSITATGGGGGGQRNNGPTNGGSGGGRGYTSTNGGLGIAGQGHNGGGSAGGVAGAGAGGGGAGASGENNDASPYVSPYETPTSGGVGRDFSATFGTSLGHNGWFGGGGGGGAHPGAPTVPGSGGNGGGGAGGVIGGNGIVGLPGTGGGGGGASTNGSKGGNGGAGIVIVAYPTGAVEATGGTMFSAQGRTIHAFTGNGNFSVTQINNNYSCDNDARCFVTVNDNLRSSFRVGMPIVDDTGQAVTIPNSGYVEILRSSTGAVWRTYTQTSTQVAQVAALCPSGATSVLGWHNAVLTNTQDSLPALPLARTIKAYSSDGTLYAGAQYLKKSFSIVEAGNYNLTVHTPNTNALAQVYVDGTLLTSARGNVATATATLGTGCHSIMVKLTWDTTQPTVDASRFTLALQQAGRQTPIVASDTSWRSVTAPVLHMSDRRAFVPSLWSAARNIAAYNSSTYNITAASWSSLTGDTSARWIGTTHSYTSTVTYPSTSTSYYINTDTTSWNFVSPTEIQLALACDDVCALYIDGNLVLRNQAPTSSISSTRLTLPAGQHRLEIGLYNDSSGAGMLFSARRTSDSVVIARSDGTNWIATEAWYSDLGSEQLLSYDTTFVPSPSQ